MSSIAQRLVAEEGHNALLLPPYAYGVITFVFFLILLGVLWSFRNTSQKYAPPGESHTSGSSQHTDASGHR